MPVQSRVDGLSAPQSSDGRDDHGAATRPICVDLDGTLIRTDVLVEGMLAAMSDHRSIGQLPRMLATSRAALKERVAAHAQVDVEHLPYNLELIAFLKQQMVQGRKLVLVTAADRQIAEAVAAHVGIFDEVIASDGARNLKAGAKARELVRRFGVKGFDYIGNARADLPVWKAAEGIGIVNAPASVAGAARAAGNVIFELSNRTSAFIAALRAMRPHQWVKNLLVFVPLLASRGFDDIGNILGALIAFAAFSATASSIYLVNDLMDLAADRRHPRKRRRPFASGALDLRLGAVLAIALMAAGLLLAQSVGALPVLLIYAAISVSYSLALKQFPLVDVFILAGLYTLRIVAGGVASHHPVTLWLLAFSGFTFLSLALVKRSGEMLQSSQTSSDRAKSRRGYRPEDRPILVMFGVASAFASSLVLALFVNTSAALQQYKVTEILWGLVPLMLFWQLRLWLATERGNMTDDPIIYAVRDWVSWIVAAAVLAIVVLASWGPSIL